MEFIQQHGQWICLGLAAIVLVMFLTLVALSNVAKNQAAVLEQIHKYDAKEIKDNDLVNILSSNKSDCIPTKETFPLLASRVFEAVVARCGLNVAHTDRILFEDTHEWEKIGRIFYNLWFALGACRGSYPDNGIRNLEHVRKAIQGLGPSAYKQMLYTYVCHIEAEYRSTAYEKAPLRTGLDMRRIIELFGQACQSDFLQESALEGIKKIQSIKTTAALVE